MSQYNVDGFFPCCGNPEEKLPGYWNLRGRFPGANYASLWSLFKWTDPMPFLQNVGWLVSSCDAEDTMKPFLCGFANNEWLPKESSRRFRHAKIGGSLKDKEGCSCVVEFSKDTSLEAKLVEVVNPGVSGATPYSFVLITIKKPYCTPKEGAKKIVQVEDRGATLYAYRFGDLSPEGARSDDCYIQLVYEAVYQQYSGLVCLNDETEREERSFCAKVHLKDSAGALHACRIRWSDKDKALSLEVLSDEEAREVNNDCCLSLGLLPRGASVEYHI